jgi:hypothetical protein
MRLVSAGQLVGTGQRITAEFGEIGTNGVYQAPSDLPPMGLDTITAEDEDGIPVAKLNVQIVPTGGYAPASQVVSPVQHDEMTGAEAGEAETDYQIGTLRTEISAPTDRALLPSVTVGGVNGQRANLSELDPHMTLLDDNTYLVLVTQSSFQGKKCGVFPPKKGSCTGGTSKVEGPWKIHRKGFGGVATATITVAGSGVTVTWNQEKATKVKYIDHYKCVNGVWQFDYTEKCIQNGVYAYGFSPSSVAFPVAGSTIVRVILGFDVNGYKFDTPVECKRT